MKTFVNLTPHTINLMNDNNETLVSFECKGNARVSMKSSFKIIDGVPQGVVEYGEIEGLPDPVENTVYILSTIAYDVAIADGRTDVCKPSGKMFRDEQGRIIGMEFLAFKSQDLIMTKLQKQKKDELNAAQTHAYNFDCSNNSGSAVEQMAYLDEKGRTRQEILDDIENESVSFEQFVKKHIVHKG